MKSAWPLLLAALLLSTLCSRAQSGYLIMGDTSSAGIYHRLGLPAETATIPGSLGTYYRPIDLEQDGSADCVLAELNSPSSSGLNLEQIFSSPIVEFYRNAAGGRMYLGDTLRSTDVNDIKLFLQTYYASPPAIDGPFPLNDDSLYVGFRYASPTGNKLGWMRLEAHTTGLVFTLSVREVALGYTAIVGTTDPAAETSFTMAPNPASQWVRLTHPQPADWRITDLTGKAMLQAQGQRDWAADVSQLAQGIYLVECTVAGQRAVRKLVVE